MQKIKKIIISLSVFLILIIPVISFAVNTPLVTCYNNCGFKELMDLINRIIQFILFDMVLPIAAIMFAYAGILLITAGGNTSSARTKAKDVFKSGVLGLGLALGAFIIIRTLLSIIGYEGSWIGFNPF